MSKFYVAATALFVTAAPTFSMAHVNIDYDPGVIENPIITAPKPVELELSKDLLPNSLSGFGNTQVVADLDGFIEFDCACNGSGGMGAISGWGSGNAAGSAGHTMGSVAGAAAGAAIGGYYGGNAGAGAGGYVGSEIGGAVGEQVIDRGGVEEGKPFAGKGSKFH